MTEESTRLTLVHPYHPMIC